MKARTHLVACLVVGAACGGNKMVLGPLQHHFQPELIASVPIDQKQLVLDAAAEHARETMMWQAADAAARDSRVAASVARNDVDERTLELKSYEERHRAAERDYDTERIANTAAELANARQLVARARAYRDYMNAREAYLAASASFAHEKLYSVEAELELARARVAHEHGIQPPGATVERFVSQRDLRQYQASVLLDRAKKKGAEAARLEAAWRELGGEPSLSPSAKADEPTP